MDIRVNDILWHIQFKKPTSSELKRSDGTISLGVGQVRLTLQRASRKRKSTQNKLKKYLRASAEH